MSEEQKYDVVYAGAIREGFSQEEVKAIFVLKFKLSAEKVEYYFSGKRMTLKKALSKVNAEELKLKLMGIGAEALIVPRVGVVDTINAREKNIKHQKLSEGRNRLNDKEEKAVITISDHLAPSKKSVQNNEPISEAELVADKDLNRKIELAKSMMIEQQLKSQISESKSSPKYVKLILFLTVLSAVIWFLLDIGKNSI